MFSPGIQGKTKAAASGHPPRIKRAVGRMLDAIPMQSEANARAQKGPRPACGSSAAPEVCADARTQEKRHKSPVLLTIPNGRGPTSKGRPEGILDVMLMPGEANARAQKGPRPACGNSAAPEVCADARTQEKRHKSPVLLTIPNDRCPTPKELSGRMLDAMPMQSEANARAQKGHRPACGNSAAPEVCADAGPQKGSG